MVCVILCDSTGEAYTLTSSQVTKHRITHASNKYDTLHLVLYFLWFAARLCTALCMDGRVVNGHTILTGITES